MAAGVNMEKMEKECFKRGAKMEVMFEDPDFRGSWFSGTVIRTATKKTRRLFIEFDNLLCDDGLKQIREPVSVILARPIPPRESVRTFKFSEEVDAYHNDGWWEGVVTAVQEGDLYTVYFRPFKEEIVFSGSDLRLHREWVKGSWVPPLDKEETTDDEGIEPGSRDEESLRSS